MTNEISIILPIWNIREIAGRCLDDILQHRRGVALEVIVGDDGSSENGPQLIGSLAPDQIAPLQPDESDPQQGIEEKAEQLSSPVHL